MSEYATVVHMHNLRLAPIVPFGPAYATLGCSGHVVNAAGKDETMRLANGQCHVRQSSKRLTTSGACRHHERSDHTRILSEFIV